MQGTSSTCEKPKRRKTRKVKTNDPNEEGLSENNNDMQDTNSTTETEERRKLKKVKTNDPNEGEDLSENEKDIHDTSTTCKKRKRKSIRSRKAEPDDSSDEVDLSDDDTEDRSSDNKLFSYTEEVRNLNLSVSEKEKLMQLSEKMSESFSLSDAQLEKIDNFIPFSAEEMESGFLMDRGLYRPETNERPINTNAYTQKEIAIIKENYLKFCKTYGFNPQNDINIFLPSTFVKRNGRDSLSIEQLHCFCICLSANLPDRPPRSVYIKFVKIFYYFRKGRFSKEEDELLKIWYELNPGKFVFSVLGRILHRHRLLVRRRILRLTGNDEEARQARKRTNYISPLVKDILHRKNDVYPEWTRNENAWEEMAKMNNQKSVKGMKKAYFREIYPSVRASKRVSSREFKLSLLDRLCSLKNPTWDSVDWAQLGEQCYKVGAVRVYSVIRTLTKKYVPKENWGDLAAAVEIITKEHSSLYKYAKRHFFIRNNAPGSIVRRKSLKGEAGQDKQTDLISKRLSSSPQVDRVEGVFETNNPPPQSDVEHQNSNAKSPRRQKKRPSVKERSEIDGLIVTESSLEKHLESKDEDDEEKNEWNVEVETGNLVNDSDIVRSPRKLRSQVRNASMTENIETEKTDQSDLVIEKPDVSSRVQNTKWKTQSGKLEVAEENSSKSISSPSEEPRSKLVKNGENEDSRHTEIEESDSGMTPRKKMVKDSENLSKLSDGGSETVDLVTPPRTRQNPRKRNII